VEIKTYSETKTNPETSPETKTTLTLEVDFNRPDDLTYMIHRMDTTFAAKAFDAAIRGPVVVGQFNFELSNGLKLSRGVSSFRF